MVFTQSQAIKPDYTGYAAHYSPGLMQRVAYNRNMDVVDCMISSPYYKLGIWVTVTSLKNNRIKVCRITDVSHPRDRQRHIKQRLIAELDFNSAKYICEITRVNQEPWRKCPISLTLFTGKLKKMAKPSVHTGIKSRLVAFKKQKTVVTSLFYPE